MIALLDYDMGNLHSVQNAFDHCHAPLTRLTAPVALPELDGLILPGVGHFADGMRNLRERGFDQLLHAAFEAHIPILGICLGLQMFFDSSEEAPGAVGLGLLKGAVKRFDCTDLKVPHMGWNEVVPTEHGAPLFDPKSAPEPYYFVHSYYVEPVEARHVLARTTYGRTFCSAAGTENLFGVQFHPEKSGDAGLALIRRFIKRCQETSTTGSKHQDTSSFSRRNNEQ